MIRRIYIEKRNEAGASAENLRKELNLLLEESIVSLRFFLRYDIDGISSEDFDSAVKTVFSEPPVDRVYFETLPDLFGYEVFAVEYLPGQYDVRADSAAQCVQLLTMGPCPEIRCALVYAVKGAKNTGKIKDYLVNPVDSRIASNEKPLSLLQNTSRPGSIGRIEGFCGFDKPELDDFHSEYALAMSLDDLLFVQDYFTKEKRDPTETEIRVLDTYWSDHCRHTTFLTELKKIEFQTEIPEIKESYDEYRKLFLKHYQNRPGKYECFMDMATIGARELKSRGLLAGLDESEEINACSIKVKAQTSDGIKDYLVMFKNETHNHPTEIEPFGGAATCLGGAIRDPLSGRSYVYHAMRVSGAADITAPIDKTIPGRLPQRVISKEAARGFSSYGNQIGLATGMVSEIYHPGYAAKRLETGFVVGAALAENVVRGIPKPGDLIVLIGGGTGRDGCGGASGSSKEHKADSIETCGAQVQKGNPVTERKIQRLFRNPEFSRIIKRCNDFGAGGVCVAIGELADGLNINLDVIPKKYQGLSGTELAISESQERMAVVIDKKDMDQIYKFCAEENLSCAAVAEVTGGRSMVMTYSEASGTGAESYACGNERVIADLKRDLLSSNGVKQTASAIIRDKIPSYMKKPGKEATHELKTGKYGAALKAEIQRLNVASNKGMSEMFDSTIGQGSIFMPFGGKRQLTPALAIAAKLPVYPLDTDTATVAAWGFDPYLSSESPYIAAQYAVLLSAAKVAAAGAPFEGIYFTFQEYFKRLKNDPERWGEPASALLGALHAQLNLGLAAIGGKDSMSGTFMDLDVPPTLISFAIAVAKASNLITNVLYDGAKVFRICIPASESGVPDYNFFTRLMKKLSRNIADGKIDFCTVIETGGAAAAVAKSCFGNGLGFKFAFSNEDLFYPRLADLLIAGDMSDFIEFSPELIGQAGGKAFSFNSLAAQGPEELSIEEAEEAYLDTLAGVFPLNAAPCQRAPDADFNNKTFKAYNDSSLASPHVLIPVFPGTNCEYDTAKKFLDAGAKVKIFVFKNRSGDDVKTSVRELSGAVKNSQIIAIPGGFSGGDEPDGSGKFIATVFRSMQVTDAVMELLENRQGLMLGICNGFQALIKLGLLPFGKIIPMTEESPTLYFNNINRHVSALCRIRVASADSPWLSNVKAGDIFMTAISHGEGRIIADENILEDLKNKGRICTQYVDSNGKPSCQTPDNPNGSMYAIEGLISPCGRILGKMGHVERAAEGLFINVPGEKNMDIFSAGVGYFR